MGDLWACGWRFRVPRLDSTGPACRWLLRRRGPGPRPRRRLVVRDRVPQGPFRGRHPERHTTAGHARGPAADEAGSNVFRLLPPTEIVVVPRGPNISRRRDML